MIRAILVEDAPLAREALVRLLKAHRDVELVGEAASASEGLALAAALSPTLMFLDIQLPDLDGIELARRLPGPRPALVFLTAFPQHALPAFEVEALDYLLKPATAEGLARALDRVRRALGRPVAAAPASPDHLEIRDGGRTLFVPLTAIDHVDAAGHYLCVHVGDAVHLLRTPIAELAERLGPAFVRTHRSAVVRVDRVVAIADRRNGDGDVRLATGATIPLSRSYRAELERRLAAARK
jgi:two-component system LytT family response regulator